MWTLPERTLERLQDHRPESAAAREVIREAHLLRTQIWSIAEELIAGHRARLSALNGRLAELPSQPGLRVQGSRYVFDLDGRDPGQPLWPVVWSLAAVLASDDATRIGSCRAQGCGWYFVDESPNRSRTWCSSEVCGNRERVRRAYAKRRSRS